MTISEERKKRVIDLYYNQGKTTREIAKIERMSIRDISAIIKEEEARRQKCEHQQHQEEISSKAYQLFSEGKRPIQVAITLNLGQPQVTKLYRDYWKLKRLHILNSIYKETNGKLGLFLKLYRLMKEKGMSIDQVVNAVDIAIHKLPYMESLYKQIKEEVNKLQYTRQSLVNDIEERKNKISFLDKIAFTSEQECKRTEQRIHELTAQKYIIEKLIANISNGEDYSKLKQIAKENVKGALAENRKLISISFVALIQTLKDDPEIIKLVYNIPRSNDGEQRKDDNNNVTNYFEVNKDRILDFAEKNYENLVKLFTNNTIDNAPSSNSTLPLPSSSPTLLHPYNQNNIYRKEESESFHGNKSDIAD